MKKSKKDSQRAFVLEMLEIINSRRKGKAVTQEDASFALGLSRPAVSQMVMGRWTIAAWHIAGWRRRWKLHISRDEMMTLVEKHLGQQSEKETI